MPTTNTRAHAARSRSITRAALVGAGALAAFALGACTHAVSFRVIDAQTGEPVEGALVTSNIERKQPTLAHKMAHDRQHEYERVTQPDGTGNIRVWNATNAYVRFEHPAYTPLELPGAVRLVRNTPAEHTLERFPTLVRTGERSYDVLMIPASMFADPEFSAQFLPTDPFPQPGAYPLAGGYPYPAGAFSDQADALTPNGAGAPAFAQEPVE